MRPFNAGKFLVVCCFCLSYGGAVFGSSTTFAKRDVDGANDTLTLIDRNIPDGDDGDSNTTSGLMSDIDPLSGLDVSKNNGTENTTSGIVPLVNGSNDTEPDSRGLGLSQLTDALDTFRNTTSNGTGSDFNSIGDLSNSGNLINDTTLGNTFGSNENSDLSPDINSKDKKNQTEGSQSENNGEYEDSDGWKKNSTKDTANEETTSNSTDSSNDSDWLDDQKNNQTSANKNTTSNLGNLLGGLFHRAGQNSSPSIPSSSGLETNDTDNWSNDQGSDLANSTNNTTIPTTDNNEESADLLNGGDQNSSQSIPSSSGLGTDDTNEWPNDQGSDLANSTNSTTSTTDDTGPVDLLRGGEQNSSQSQNISSSSTNYTSDSDENIPSSFNSTSPDQNVNSTQLPITSTTPTPPTATKYSAAYWIPIFNFNNDFYFLTHKGYAKLVNFPPPVIYSFTPVPLRKTTETTSQPTIGQPRQNYDSSSTFFDSDSPDFADCYVNANMGNLIPYSYFGSWVAVFNLENGWNLQTYDGYVPLDLYGEEAPVAYEFVPSKYELSTTTPLVDEILEIMSSNDPYDSGLASWSIKDNGGSDGWTTRGDGGLASWSEPIVVEG